MSSILVRLLLVCLIVSTPVRVLASGFAAPSVGPTNAGVSTVDAAGVHYNPGGLGFLEAVSVYAGGNLMVGDLRYQRDRRATYQYSDSLDFALPIDPLLIDADKRGRDLAVSDRPIGAVPAFFAAVPLSGLPLVVGLGAYVPYAADVSFPKTGAQRFQLIEAFIANVYFTPSIAWRPIERLSIGAGISYVWGMANLSKIQDLATLPDLGQALARPPIGQSNEFGLDADPAVRELDTLARPFVFKRGRAHGATFNVGLSAEPIDDLWVGASYEHSTKLTYRGEFSLDMNDPFFTQDLQSQGLAYPPLVKGQATLSFVLPRVVRLGVRWAFGKRIDSARRTSLALEGSYTGWSSLDVFDVRLKSKSLAQPALGLPSSTRFELRRDWYDTFGGVLRAQHAVSRELSLWGLIGVETGATPDSTIDVASPDGTRISVAVGFAQNLTARLRLILDAQLQSVLEREVVASHHDLGNGSYQMRIFAVGVYGAYAF